MNRPFFYSWPDRRMIIIIIILCYPDQIAGESGGPKSSVLDLFRPKKMCFRTINMCFQVRIFLSLLPRRANDDSAYYIPIHSNQYIPLIILRFEQLHCPFNMFTFWCAPIAFLFSYHGFRLKILDLNNWNVSTKMFPFTVVQCDNVLLWSFFCFNIPFKWGTLHQFYA